MKTNKILFAINAKAAKSFKKREPVDNLSIEFIYKGTGVYFFFTFLRWSRSER